MTRRGGTPDPSGTSRRRRRVAVFATLLLLTSACAGTPAQVGSNETTVTSGTHPDTTIPPARPDSLAVPDPGLLYHGVYPGGVTGWEDDVTPADVEAYEHAAGRRVAWIYFSHNWFHGRSFPEETVTWIEERGSIPFIRLMLRSDVDAVDGPDPSYSLERIVAGDFDDDLVAWGRAAARHGPLIVEWGTEMNGAWFPWNGVWNGGAGAGPALFRRAYRHIVDRAEAGGADLTWVFHVNASDDPAADWNRFEQYYPGDDVVDWLGVSAYGVLTPTENGWIDFDLQLDDALPRLTALAPDKPIFLLEFGVTGNNPHGEATRWADDALTGILSGRWPELRGFSWWNETWENDDDPAHDTDMRLQTVPGLADVFHRHLAGNPRVLDHPILERRP